MQVPAEKNRADMQTMPLEPSYSGMIMGLLPLRCIATERSAQRSLSSMSLVIASVGSAESSASMGACAPMLVRIELKDPFSGGRLDWSRWPTQHVRFYVIARVSSAAASTPPTEQRAQTDLVQSISYCDMDLEALRVEVVL